MSDLAQQTIDEGHALQAGPADLQQPSHQSEHSPTEKKFYRRKNSSASRHVPVDHFDPEGYNELRRTFTSHSALPESTGGDQQEPVPPLPGKRSSRSSGLTAVGDNQDEKFDLAVVLQDIMNKRNEEDIKGRVLGVAFQDLRVIGTGASATYQPTVGSLFSPSGIAEKIRSIRHPALRDIISGFEGVVTPGEMLLVLGSPGSGCSTLLKTLANHRGEYHAIEGDVYYDSFTPEQIAKHHRGDVTYCPEDDVHFPTLTVQQTLAFAAKTRAPRKRLQNQSREDYVEHILDVLTTVFGLRHAKNTPVGDASIRGVSGGEKKRVSIAEALASRSLIGAWDNSTRGLDASTALEFVRALRIATDIVRATTIVSIYQAGESLYELFDKVCVISEGKMAYFGPASEARQYFIDMGFKPADRQTTADFLVAVTDPNGRITQPGYETRVPRTSAEMASAFYNSVAGHANRAAIAEYRDQHVGKVEKVAAYRQSMSQEHARHTHESSAYMISIPMQVRAVMVRRVQIIRGDMAAQAIQLFSYFFQAVIMGTVFLQMPESTSAYFSRGGVLFFSLLFAAISALAEIPALYAQRPIVNRHQKAAMYHPFVEALALTLVDIPISFVTQVVYSVVLYFLVRLQQTPSQFFIFFLYIFTAALTMKAFFRSLAAAFKAESAAQSLAGVMVLVLVIYTGYTIPQPSMIGALRWITYINPMRYGFEGILVNEFHTLDGSCASLVPSGAGYSNVSLTNQVCTIVGSQPGQAFVDGNAFASLSYGYRYSHLWRNYGILIAFATLFISVLLLLTENNTASANETSVTLFKRGSKIDVVEEQQQGATDEEKGDATAAPSSSSSTPGTVQRSEDEKQAAAEMEGQLATSDVFSWQHVQYVVPLKHGEHRMLLDDVSGYVAPGKLTALMGESGAGKTTLLNVLAQRVGTGVVSGDRFVNGQPLPEDFQAQTGYCQQMDTHLPETTVREALLFSAKLRQPSSVPMAEKEAYVEVCLKMCGLEAYADAIVGSLGVEHRKRTTIGVELAAKPKLLLFLDEPTSGLDSQSAWAIMQFLRSLADHGQAILCTIHQPSGELFNVFDRLLLLKKGGKTVYFGDLGDNSATLIEYFERHGADSCGPNENPAEWMLNVIGAGATATSETDWHDVWMRSEETERVQEDINAIHAEGRKRPAVQATRHSQFSTSWGYQLVTLTRRAFQSYWRNPTYIMAKLMLNIIGGLFIGFTFFKSKDSLQGSQNKLFSFFMATVLAVPLSNQLQSVFIAFRNIYEIRERPSRMYSWTALVTSQLLVELPWNILGSSLFFLCHFWTVGYHSNRAGYNYLAYGVMFPLYYTTIAQAVTSMAPNVVIASILFSTLFSFVITFNGVLQPFSQLGWWRWMYRVSPFTYLIEGLLGQAIGRQEITCAAKEYVNLNPPSGQTCSGYMQQYIDRAGGYLTNPDATSNCQFCSYRTTDQYLLTNFNIEYAHRWRNIGILCGVVCFNIAGIFFFTYMFRIRTKSIFTSLKNRLRPRKN